MSDEHEEYGQGDSYLPLQFESEVPVTKERKERAAAAMGLHIVENAGGGNCLYHATIQGLGLHPELHQDARASVGRLMLANKNQFEFFVEENMALDSFITREMTPNVDAGTVALTCLAFLSAYSYTIRSQKHWLSMTAGFTSLTHSHLQTQLQMSSAS